MFPFILAILTVTGLVGAIWFWDRLERNRPPEATGPDDPGQLAWAESLHRPPAPPGLDFKPMPWGVVIQAGQGRALAVHLPLTDPSIETNWSQPELGESAIEMIVAMPHETGHVWPAALAERLGVSRARTFTTGDETGHGVLSFGERRLLGALTITAGETSVLVTHQNGRRLLVGHQIPLERLEQRPVPDVFLGSIDPTAALEGVEQKAGSLARLREIVLLTAVPPVLPPVQFDAELAFLSLLGIPITVVSGDYADPWRNRLEARILQLAQEKPDDLHEAIQEMTDGQIADAIIEGVVTDEMDAAMLLATTAAETREHGVFDFHLGTLALMNGNLEAARVHFRRAVDGSPPYLEAWPSLVSTAFTLDRHDEARAALEAGLGVLPEDPITITSAVCVLAAMGEVEDARELLAGKADVLDVSTHAKLSMILDGNAAEALPPPGDRFPYHASLALQRGAAAADLERFEEAERLLRRAMELDPQSIEAATELGRLLSHTGQDDKALAWYGQCLSRMDAGELLRFNRGNCLVRLGRLAEAVKDYERCVELAPEWANARINAVSAYCALGDANTARSHLAVLAETPGVDPALLDELHRQVDAATDP